MKCARKTRAEERRKPMEGREVARSRKLAAMSTPVSLPLSLSLPFSPSPRPFLPSMPPPVCTAPPRDIVRCTFQARVRARRRRKERREERELARGATEEGEREKKGDREPRSVLRARENKIVKRRSRCDVANEVQPSLSFANRDLRPRYRGFDSIGWSNEL